MSAHDAHATPGVHKAHICSIALFTQVFVSLMVLTVITVYTAKFVNLGHFNIVLALLIASVKATLVISFFMHLKYDTAMNQIAILSSFLFLALLFLFTLGDLSTRGKVTQTNVRTAPMNMDLETQRGYLSWLIKAVNPPGKHAAGSQPSASHGTESHPTSK
jgi:cytochrome c oxidase subunit 4